MHKRLVPRRLKWQFECRGIPIRNASYDRKKQMLRFSFVAALMVSALPAMAQQEVATCWYSSTGVSNGVDYGNLSVNNNLMNAAVWEPDTTGDYALTVIVPRTGDNFTCPASLDVGQ
jgi:hypothetical protein